MRLVLVLAALLLAPTARAGETAWTTRDVAAMRFPDGDLPGPTLVSGDQVEVVLREGDRARIRKDDRYGWVPASALTTEPPPGWQPATGTMPGFDLEAIRASLQKGLTGEAPPAGTPPAPAGGN